MKNKEEGWISLHRQLKKKGYYKKSSYVHLWVHLLLSVNHKNKEFMWNGEIIIVKEGQLLTGRKQLSIETGIKQSTIERILKMLENEHQIEQQKTNKYRLITIVNWKEYQDIDNKADNKRTTSGQQADTNNNVNNVNNDNKKEEISQTPSELAKDFFEEGKTYSDMLEIYSKNADKGWLEKEFKKFILYWTEPNKSGTKVRWEQQATFEIKRRLYTWLNKSREFNKPSKKQEKIWM